MPSSSDRSTSSGRRILSRIALPFANKGRNTPDFYIQVQDAHRQYGPGDVVRGSVVVKVLKPVRITHIAICLHGFVQVFKTSNSPPGEHFWRTNTALGRGTGKKSGEYFGNGFATLFEDEVVLCGEGRLRDGSYQFDFEVAFPDTDLPSSIEVSASRFYLFACANLSASVRERNYFLHAHCYHDPAGDNISCHLFRPQSIFHGTD